MTPWEKRIPNDENYWNVFFERARDIAVRIEKKFGVKTKVEREEIPWPYGVDYKTGLYTAMRNFIRVHKPDGTMLTYELTPIVYDTLNADHDLVAMKIGEVLGLKEVVIETSAPKLMENPIGKPYGFIERYYYPAKGDNWPTGTIYTAPDGKRYYKSASLAGPYWYLLD